MLLAEVACSLCQQADEVEGKVPLITEVMWGRGKWAGSSAAALMSGDTGPGRVAGLQGSILS